jgi:hypothetical protein
VRNETNPAQMDDAMIRRGARGIRFRIEDSPAHKVDVLVGIPK